MNNYDFIVYGNSIGALFSALELGKTHKIALVNPAPNWGAHFAGVKIDNVSYDIGMNYFEFTTFHEQSDNLLTYNPEIRNDSARFFHLIEKYFEKRISLVHVPTAICYLDGLYADDIIISNKLDILKQLPDTLVSKIKEELEHILAAGRSELHASNKKKNEDLFLSKNYCEVSIANHGKTFHDLFVEPICKKIFNISSQEIPALFHRIAWAPLFYPETLLQAIAKSDDTMLSTDFHYPSEGYFAKCVDVIMDEIKGNSNITIIQQRVDRIAFENDYVFYSGENRINAKQLVWCSDLLGLLSLTGINVNTTQFVKASIALVFLSVDKDLISKKFSTLYVCDTDEPLYRITNQDYSAQNNNDSDRLIFEFNNDVLLEKGIDNEEKLIADVRQFLTKAGIVTKEISKDQFNVKIFKNAVNLPLLENFSNFQGLHAEVLEKLKNIELVGMATGFVATSFNDQIVQAMKLGEKYK